jgi:hypothetical protein
VLGSIDGVFDGLLVEGVEVGDSLGLAVVDATSPRHKDTTASLLNS